MTYHEAATSELEALAVQLRTRLEETDPTTNARRAQHLRLQLGAVELVLDSRKERP